MSKKWLAAVTFLLLAGITLFLLQRQRRPQRERREQRVFPVMGTVGKFTVYADDADELEAALNRAQTRVREIEKVCNIFNPDSELSRLNRTAFDREVTCSPLLWKLLMEADRFYRVSGGAFDATVKPLMELWGFHRPRASLPSEKEIAAARARTGWDKVKLDVKKHSVRFLAPGLGIDLGGIAKGFALDQAAAAVRAAGVFCAVLDLGGNICCFAPVPHRPFRIGVRDPDNPAAALETVDMRDHAIATSGDYERYVVIGGKRYGHIMDPRTGLPVTGMRSVSVVTPRGVDSDALSTAIFVKGEQFAAEVCRQVPAAGVLMVKEDPEEPAGRRILRYGLFASSPASAPAVRTRGGHMP